MRSLYRPTRLLFAGAVASAMLLGLAAKAPAETLEWSGTFQLIISQFPPDEFFATGTGVSTVTTSGAAGDIAAFAHLDSLRMNHGLTITGTLPLTDPENATLITLVIDTDGARIGIPLGRGTFAPISGGGPLTDNQLTNTDIAGILPPRFKQCFIVPGCSAYLPIPFSKNGLTGAGIGGLITINTFSIGAGLKISILGTPWTLGAAVISGLQNRITLTQNGVITTRFTVETTRTEFGFVHGPASNTSSTAKLSGVIQLVAPTEISTSLDPPNRRSGTWTILRLHFIPEPGLALLLGSGVAGLVLLGRHRLRR